MQPSVTATLVRTATVVSPPMRLPVAVPVAARAPASVVVSLHSPSIPCYEYHCLLTDMARPRLEVPPGSRRPPHQERSWVS